MRNLSLFLAPSYMKMFSHRWWLLKVYVSTFWCSFFCDQAVQTSFSRSCSSTLASWCILLTSWIVRLSYFATVKIWSTGRTPSSLKGLVTEGDFSFVLNRVEWGKTNQRGKTGQLVNLCITSQIDLFLTWLVFTMSVSSKVKSAVVAACAAAAAALFLASNF